MQLETRHIAKLERDVTRLGIGVLPMGPLQRGLTVDEGARVVRAAVESGVTFIDTAAAYRTYDHVAAGLEGFPGQLTIATKSNARADGAGADEQVETALRALERDGIDIMLCHCGRGVYTDEEWGPTLEVLLAAKERGDIRMVGASAHSVEGVRIATAHPDLEVIHPLINMTGMGIIDGTADEMLAAIRDAHRAGMLVYAMKAMAGGNLVPDREQALRYVFDVPEIDLVAVGMVTPDEVEWNVRFASGAEIPEDLAERTALHSKRLDILHVICKGCGECIPHCENDALSLVDEQAVVDGARCILCGYCAPHCPMFAIRMV